MTQEQVLAHSSASASAPGNTSCITHRKPTTSPTTVSSGNDHARSKTQLSRRSSRLHAPLQMTPQDSTFSTVAHDTWQTLPPGLKHTFAQPQFRTFSSKAHPPNFVTRIPSEELKTKSTTCIFTHCSLEGGLDDKLTTDGTAQQTQKSHPHEPCHSNTN